MRRKDAIVQELLVPHPDLDARLDLLVREVAAHYNVDACFLTLRGDQAIHLKAHVCDFEPDEAVGADLFGHSIEREMPTIMYDARSNPSFQKHPLVTGAPNVRFYAGAPLAFSPGLFLGTLSIFANKPRQPFTLTDCAFLMNKAKEAVDALQEAQGASKGAGSEGAMCSASSDG